MSAASTTTSNISSQLDLPTVVALVVLVVGSEAAVEGPVVVNVVVATEMLLVL